MNSMTTEQRAQVFMGVGVAGSVAMRVLLRMTDGDSAQLAALGIGLLAAVAFCYGTGQYAITRGHSAAWGCAGVFGYLLLRLVLKPKPARGPIPPPAPRRIPPPPPPPGYVPTR